MKIVCVCAAYCLTDSTAMIQMLGESLKLDAKTDFETTADTVELFKNKENTMAVLQVVAGEKVAQSHEKSTLKKRRIAICEALGDCDLDLPYMAFPRSGYIDHGKTMTSVTGYQNLKAAVTKWQNSLSKP